MKAKKEKSVSVSVSWQQRNQSINQQANKTPESLLASSVPDLKLYLDVIHHSSRTRKRSEYGACIQEERA